MVDGCNEREWFNGHVTKHASLVASGWHQQLGYLTIWQHLVVGANGLFGSSTTSGWWHKWVG
jgi:hypothetical protein